MVELVTGSPEYWRNLMRTRVGAFYRNAYPPGAMGVCGVCSGPAKNELCAPCASQRHTFGNRLADRVVVLFYAQGQHPGHKHQSAHDVQAYKYELPVAKCRDNLCLTAGVAIDLHGSCIQSAVGVTWDSVTFVPSAKRPGVSHPVVNIAKAVATEAEIASRFLLTVNPEASANREVVPDRFSVAPEYLDRVEGSNVLIVDDTWATGAKAQSAAIAAKAAGAASVTVLCVARWLRWDWPDHAALLKTCTQLYDAFICPVSGEQCVT